MKPFAAILAAGVFLLPTLATAQTCNKAWRAKYGNSCPAGSSYDAGTRSCIVHGS